METFATIEDYQARYGTASDEGVLEQALVDATVLMRRTLDAAGVDYSDPDELYAQTLASVCRAVAHRCMPDDTALPADVTQMSETVGPYSQSFSFGTVYSSPKLYRDELRMLGVGARIGFASPGWGDDD